MTESALIPADSRENRPRTRHGPGPGVRPPIQGLQHRPGLPVRLA